MESSFCIGQYFKRKLSEVIIFTFSYILNAHLQKMLFSNDLNAKAAKTVIPVFSFKLI